MSSEIGPDMDATEERRNSRVADVAQAPHAAQDSQPKATEMTTIAWPSLASRPLPAHPDQLKLDVLTSDESKIPKTNGNTEKSSHICASSDSSLDDNATPRAAVSAVSSVASRWAKQIVATSLQIPLISILSPQQGSMPSAKPSDPPNPSINTDRNIKASSMHEIILESSSNPSNGDSLNRASTPASPKAQVPAKASPCVSPPLQHQNLMRARSKTTSDTSSVLPKLPRRPKHDLRSSASEAVLATKPVVATSSVTAIGQLEAARASSSQPLQSASATTTRSTTLSGLETCENETELLDTMRSRAATAQPTEAARPPDYHISRHESIGDISTTAREYALRGKQSKNAAFHATFPNISPQEALIEDYSCALQKEILVQGRMYLTLDHVCFNADIFGWVTMLVLPFEDVVSINRRTTAKIFPNAIEIETRKQKYFFASFIFRENAYTLMAALWHRSSDTSPFPLLYEDAVIHEAITNSPSRARKLLNKAKRIHRSSENHAGTFINAILNRGSRNSSTSKLNEDAKCLSSPTNSELSFGIFDSSTSCDDSSVHGSKDEDEMPRPREESCRKLHKTMKGDYDEFSQSWNWEERTVVESASDDDVDQASNEAHVAARDELSNSNRTIADTGSKPVISLNGRSFSENLPLQPSNRVIIAENPMRRAKSSDIQVENRREARTANNGKKSNSEKTTRSSTQEIQLPSIPTPPGPCCCPHHETIVCESIWPGLLPEQCFDYTYSNRSVHPSTIDVSASDSGVEPPNGFIYNLLIDSLECRDFSWKDWDEDSGETCVHASAPATRNRKYLMPLRHNMPMAPKQTMVEIVEELVEYSPAKIVLSAKITTPDVPSGASFAIHSLVCFALTVDQDECEGAPMATCVKTSAVVRWSKSAWMIKAAVETGAIDGQKKYWESVNCKMDSIISAAVKKYSRLVKSESFSGQRRESDIPRPVISPTKKKASLPNPNFRTNKSPSIKHHRSLSGHRHHGTPTHRRNLREIYAKHIASRGRLWWWTRPPRVFLICLAMLGMFNLLLLLQIRDLKSQLHEVSQRTMYSNSLATRENVTNPVPQHQVMVYTWQAIDRVLKHIQADMSESLENANRQGDEQ